MNDKSETRTLQDIGEFGLIEHIAENIKTKNKSSVLGIGDDAAIIDNKEKYTVITSDMLMEGIHFDLMYTPLKHLGYKSVIVNLSDVYAMNAIPRQITVNIAVSAKFNVQMIDDLYEGIKLACELYNVDLVGGDTTSSLTGLAISVTAIGEAEPDQIVRRSGARVNDLICVSGNLGAAYMGLQLLEREKRIFSENPKMQPDLTGFEYIIERQLKPEAGKEIIEFFKEKEFVPTSMMDISDGLSSELIHICKQSKTGCRIYEEKLPIHPNTEKMAREFNINPTVAALNGGEDYELLFTLAQDDFEKIKFSENISVIGHITAAEDGLNVFTADEKSYPVEAQGWNSFQK